jgi:DNA-binding NarL/FixJ family response regulator
MQDLSKGSTYAMRKGQDGTGPTPKDVADASEQAPIVLIAGRFLVRECLARCLNSGANQRVVSHASIADWLQTAGQTPASLIVLCVLSDQPSLEKRGQDLRDVCAAANDVPIIVVADDDRLENICNALDLGIRGYIPTNLSLEVVIEAINLVRAGGLFVPASCLIAARRAHDVSALPNQTGRFTPRQKSVIDALRKGKTNKIIACELNMEESTVKVHVRHIMKKLGARNRTEVALMANGLFEHRGAAVRHPIDLAEVRRRVVPVVEGFDCAPRDAPPR